MSLREQLIVTQRRFTWSERERERERETRDSLNTIHCSSGLWLPFHVTFPSVVPSSLVVSWLSIHPLRICSSMIEKMPVISFSLKAFKRQFSFNWSSLVVPLLLSRIQSQVHLVWYLWDERRKQKKEGTHTRNITSVRQVWATMTVIQLDSQRAWLFLSSCWKVTRKESGVRSK
jgi:hypothetical protein